MAKEATKIKSGESPAAKTGTAARPVPFETDAAKLIIGAIAHSNQVTRFGFTFPFNIDFT